MEITQLVNDRAKLIAQARQILDKAEKENRSVTSEENQQFEKMMNDADEMKTKIERRSKLETAEGAVAEWTGRKAADAAMETTDTTNLAARQKPEYRTAFEQMLRYGKEVLKPQEARILQEGVFAQGGAVLPQEYEKTLVKCIQDWNIMRQVSKVSVPPAIGTFRLRRAFLLQPGSARLYRFRKPNRRLTELSLALMQ